MERSSNLLNYKLSFTLFFSFFTELSWQSHASEGQVTVLDIRGTPKILRYPVERPNEAYIAEAKKKNAELQELLGNTWQASSLQVEETFDVGEVIATKANESVLMSWSKSERIIIGENSVLRRYRHPKHIQGQDSNLGGHYAWYLEYGAVRIWSQTENPSSEVSRIRMPRLVIDATSADTWLVRRKKKITVLQIDGQSKLSQLSQQESDRFKNEIQIVVESDASKEHSQVNTLIESEPMVLSSGQKILWREPLSESEMKTLGKTLSGPELDQLKRKTQQFVLSDTESQDLVQVNQLGQMYQLPLLAAPSVKPDQTQPVETTKLIQLLGGYGETSRLHTLQLGVHYRDYDISTDILTGKFQRLGFELSLWHRPYPWLYVSAGISFGSWLSPDLTDENGSSSASFVIEDFIVYVFGMGVRYEFAGVFEAFAGVVFTSASEAVVTFPLFAEENFVYLIEFAQTFDWQLGLRYYHSDDWEGYAAINLSQIPAAVSGLNEGGRIDTIAPSTRMTLGIARKI
ncbi:MAG: hypothetical protein HRU19_13500 [Pseudobacteriovorax sp.]|nr:hypothetical protein [Pseudobacteriovorax sp.]